MRLIDADEIEYFPLDEVFNHSVMIAFKERIDVIPTVELIRCKDCKHWFQGSCFVDSFNSYDDFNYERDETDFCSRAERKEE